MLIGNSILSSLNTGLTFSIHIYWFNYASVFGL